MRRHHAFLFIALLVAGATAESRDLFERPINADCVSGTGDASVFPDQFVLPGGYKVNGTTYVESAVGFSVEYYPNYKLVNNSEAGELYVLYQCGTSAPARSEFPLGTKFFQIPLVSVVVPETVPYAALDRLDLTDRVYSVPNYVVAPCGQKLLTCPNDSREAPDFMFATNLTELEETVSLVADGVLQSYASPISDSIAFSASTEPGVLRRAEWIKFLALFFNKEKEAAELYDSIEAEYNALKDAAAKEFADVSTPNPVVAFVSHVSYGGKEYYQISWAPYKAQLAADSGAEMLNITEVAAIPGVKADTFAPKTTLVFRWDANDTFPDKQAALDAFLEVLSKVDVLFDETYSTTPLDYNVTAFLKEYGISEEEALLEPWFAEQKVYRQDGTLSLNQEGFANGMDWFEGALVYPAKVLKDVVRAVRPELTAALQPLESDGKQQNPFIWIRNLFTETPHVKTPADCTAATSCDTTPVPICPFVKPCQPSAGGAAPKPALLKGTEGDACIYEKCSTA